MATFLTGTPADVGGEPPEAANLKQKLRSLLEPGERLLWQGFPRQGIMLRPQDAYFIPFSLLWGGFAIFWEFSVTVSAHAPLFFQLWGIPFVCVGLYMIGGRFIWDARIRARTIYALTDQRILILSGVSKRNVRSVELAMLSEINLIETAEGRGTITFGPQTPYGAGMRGWPNAGRALPPAFEGIHRARDVLEIIRDATKSAGATRNS